VNIVPRTLSLKKNHSVVQQRISRQTRASLSSLDCVLSLRSFGAFRNYFLKTLNLTSVTQMVCKTRFLLGINVTHIVWNILEILLYFHYTAILL